MSADTGGPAFAQQLECNRDGYAVTGGMTLRDYFASSFVASGHVFKLLSSGNTPDEVAEQAYALADAMLKAREV
jgi:hypothetical protein